MFSGIVERIATVRRVEPIGDAAPTAMRLAIPLDDWAPESRLGASISINGVCLTLAQLDVDGTGAFDVIPETLRATNLGALAAGSRVNLERALRVGNRVDGHFVQGHIDGTGTVERIDAGRDHLLTIAASEHVLRYVIHKGSIAIDGVSLTVAGRTDQSFTVALIPTTLTATTLGQRRVSDAVNLETDIVSRTIVDRLATQSPPTLAARTAATS